MRANAFLRLKKEYKFRS